MSYVIGCDVGTSGTKAIVVSEAGKVLAKVMVEYPLSTPHPGWAEQTPRHLGKGGLWGHRRGCQKVGSKSP